MKILYSTLLLVTFLQVGYAQDPVITFSETEIYCNGTDTLFVNVANAADIKGVYNYTQSMNPCFSDEISGTIEITEFDEFTENEYSVSDFSFGAWGACYFIDPPTGNLRWTLDGSLITWPGTDNYGEQWQFDSFESTGDSYTFTYSNTYAETGFVTLSKVDGSTLPFLTIDPSENTNNEYTYNWSTGSTDNFIVISENGTYSVTISDGVNNYEREYELMNAEQEHPDFNALSDLYNSTNGIVWDNREGWENAIENNIGCNPCKGWIGVTCLDNRVIEIDLTENNLTGVLTPAIQELNALTELNLSFNLIGGEIPKELGNLENLSRLTLTQNQLTGTIPSELSNLQNLNSLSLSSNLLTGEIPEEFGNLNLFSLGLGNNRLTGSIPNSLANIDGLRLLTLGPNLLTGEFPNEIVENKFMFFLSLWGNQLEGPLPTGLTDVGLIDLRYNNFSGTIPEEYGEYNSIFGLRLDGNQLEGEIPNSIYASAGL
ncbi:MAG: hypothetical protein HKO66_05295, partial [Saprospiraceae bacterium]|nr:hypothetical protein [Saprospiraceae bacterium]